VTLESRISELRATGTTVTLSALGGEDVLLVDSDNATGPYFADVAEAVVNSWGVADHQKAWRLIATGLRQNTSPLVLANAGDHLFTEAAVPILQDHASDLLDICLDRAKTRGSTERTAYSAAIMLDVATRLTIGGWSDRFALLSVLTRVQAAEPGIFVRLVARLAGRCFERWRDPETRALLNRCLDNEEASVDAAFELGVASFAEALERDSQDSVLGGLEASRAWFERATRAEENRSDAEMFQTITEIFSAFHAGLGINVIADLVNCLRSTLLVRSAWMERAIWREPQPTAAVEWWRLCEQLLVATRAMRPSFLDPVPYLMQLVEAYVAHRSIRLPVIGAPAGEGAIHILQPPIVAAFVRHEGMRQHLQDWLEQQGESLDPTPRAGASSLLEQVQIALKKKIQPRRTTH
jgi:hypothetical protein